MWDVPWNGIAAGTTTTIRIWNLPAPAVCAVQVAFPDGSTKNLGSVTAVWVGPSPGSSAAFAASWSLAVPAGMALGVARLTTQCSYLGVERINDWFAFSVNAP